MMRNADWYDSAWLNVFYRAIDKIEATDPARVEGFVRSFDALRTDSGFRTCHIKRAIDPGVLEDIRAVIRALPMDKMELHELRSFGRFVVHDLPEFTSLQKDMTDRVSQLAGEALSPSYNFLSLYTHAGECKPHLDAPSAKWTLDICIDQSEVWPIHLSAVQPWPDVRLKTDDPRSGHDFTAFAMEPGDALLFSGSSQWHYRDAFPRDGVRRTCDLLFMHFIPKGTEQLVNPANWATMFDLPTLKSVEGIDDAR